MLIMVLALTPLAIEQTALCASLGRPERVIEMGGLTVSCFANDVVTAVGGHGKVEFALTTQMLTAALSPSLIVCAGGCGALVPYLELLDVVVAESTVEHDIRLHYVKRPPPSFAGSSMHLAALRGASLDIRFGTVASGDEDVVDPSRASAIRDLTGAIAVAWEGAGGARAAQFCEVPFLEVRCVVDTADGNAAADFHANIREGMAKVAEIIKFLG